ncbi:MAG: type II toxin-antitoxin system VapC family toxin [Chloroflexota bacterium]
MNEKARKFIEDESNRVFLSAASLWEMAIKISLGKLTLSEPFETLIPEQLSLNGIEILDITVAQATQVVRLPFHYRDSFDRLLIAQALADEIPIISGDEAFDAYGITRLW